MTQPITTIYEFKGSTGKIRRGLVLETQGKLARVIMDEDLSLRSGVRLNDVDRIIYSASIVWTHWQTQQENAVIALLPVGSIDAWNSALVGRVAAHPTDVALI